MHLLFDQKTQIKHHLEILRRTTTVKFTSGSINVQHNAKAKTPLSLHQWTDAFLIFTCFYLDKFPLEAPHLSKYL